MKSRIESFFIKHSGKRICQGDIFRDFEYIEFVSNNKKIGTGIKKIFPYLLVLSQDCDLESDHKNHIECKDNQDKYLISILVCPGYSAEALREGNHLKEYGLKMNRIDSDRWKIIKNNQNPRYHFLRGVQELQIPNLVVDFKHYYTISRDMLYENFKDYYLSSINELFRSKIYQLFK